MDKRKSIGFMIFLFCQAFSSHKQHVSFECILEGINNPLSDSFEKELTDNKFIMVSPYKNRFKPEIWDYNYNPANNIALSWVHYY